MTWPQLYKTGFVHLVGSLEDGYPHCFDQCVDLDAVMRTSKVYHPVRVISGDEIGKKSLMTRGGVLGMLGGGTAVPPPHILNLKGNLPNGCGTILKIPITLGKAQ